MAEIIEDRISSVPCPKCGFHVYANHKDIIYCRKCKKPFEVDEPYKAAIGKGINSRDYTWHISCFDPTEAKRLGASQTLK